MVSTHKLTVVLSLTAAVFVVAISSAGAPRLQADTSAFNFSALGIHSFRDIIDALRMEFTGSRPAASQPSDGSTGDTSVGGSDSGSNNGTNGNNQGPQGPGGDGFGDDDGNDTGNGDGGQSGNCGEGNWCVDGIHRPDAPENCVKAAPIGRSCKNGQGMCFRCREQRGSGDTPPDRDGEGDGNDTCQRQECGPYLGLPNRLCPDGKNVAGPTGRCLRDADSSCGWEIKECPSDSGGPGQGGDDRDDQGDDCMCPEDMLWRAGRCVAIPSGMHCPSVRREVCGCNGETYENECYAIQAGVKKFSAGACGRR